MAQNLPRGTPARLLVLLTLLTGLVAVSAWRDALQRERAVWVNYPTALGDRNFFQPAQLPVEVRVGGRVVRLTAAGGKTLRRKEAGMYRVGAGIENELPFQLYSPRENPAQSEEAHLYAHTAPGEFILLHAGVGQNGDPGTRATDQGSKTTPAPVPAGDPLQPGTLPPSGDSPDKTAANKSL